MHSIILSLFFLHCHRDHRDLHSFPTRRSSDLSPAGFGSCLFARLQKSRNSFSPVTGTATTTTTSSGLAGTDRKSTRLNSSHGYISYAVFCLKKKKHDSIKLLHYIYH